MEIIKQKRININTGAEVKPSEVGMWNNASMEQWRYALTHKTWLQKMEYKISRNEQRKVFTNWRENVHTFLSGSRGLFDRSITKKARSLDMDYDEVTELASEASYTATTHKYYQKHKIEFGSELERESAKL